MARQRVFIVQPSSLFPHDKRHDVCVTKRAGDLMDIYGADEFEVKGSRQTMAWAKGLAGTLGAKRPKVI